MKGIENAFVGERGEKIKDRITDKIKDSIQEGGIDALGDLAEDYLDDLNIEPVFVQEEGEDFEEMRRRLNTEPGFLISNHPGYIDVATIFKCLDREDIKIMVAKNSSDEYKEAVGEEFIISASRDPSELRKTMREVQEHIEAGGLFIIFPSGRADTGEIDFQEGFPFLLNQVDSDTMVYNFHFDEGDVREIQSEMPERNIGLASSLLFTSTVNPNRLRERKEFRVDETYTTAGEWQEVISQGDKKERSQRTTEHYKQIFAGRATN